MKPRFHFLWFYCCLIGLLSFSSQEIKDQVIIQLEGHYVANNNHSKSPKDTEEKKFRKEEENEKEENQEEDTSEDAEIEEEVSEYPPLLASFFNCFGKQCLVHNIYSRNDVASQHTNNFPKHLPLYILFACLKIDC